MSTVFALPREQKRNGVMLFTPNIAHAQMVLAALAVKRAALITHKTPRRERQKIVEDFRNKKLRYLVNVGTLTTGFDVPHVDLIAILRATESASLFQQIIGRGLRPSEDTEKRDCLILDYAENLARHCPDGDPFSPSIRAAAAMDKERMEQVDVTGPICSGIHQFRPAKHVTGTTKDANGYLRLEINNRLITNAAGDPIAGHLGRQCNHRHRDEDGKARRCQHTWACRECPRCGLLNTAYNRFCTPMHGTSHRWRQGHPL